jgi:hypothetical protein
MAQARFDNYKNQPFTFPAHFGKKPVIDSRNHVKAAIIRERVTLNVRWQTPCTGLMLRDVHMTDLISGRETWNIQFIGIVGGFQSDVGSAKVGQERFIQRKSK